MGGILETIDRASFDSLMEWWRIAGVDQPVGETPRAWLRTETTPHKINEAGPKIESGNPPTDLQTFRQWLAMAPGLPLDRPGAARVMPVGEECSPLMLLTDVPDREGEASQLLRRMLAAIGLDATSSYMASLATFHSPGARIAPNELERCAEIARDHIRFARPQRLVLFGDAAARALVGQPLAQARGRVHKVEGVRAVATFHPRWLLQRPSDKALAWRDLLLVMSDSE